MQRNEWQFSYTISQLLQAVVERAAHHEDRLAYWTRKLEDAKKALKEEGIDFHERVAAHSRLGSTQYVDQPVFDSEKLKDLSEAKERVAHHKSEIEKFESWAAVFGNEPDRNRTLLLHHDDVLFFGLHL